MTRRSEPEAWATAATLRGREGARPTRTRASHPGQHVLTFLQIATHDLGAAPVADAERDLDRLELPVGGLHPEAPSDGASAASATATRAGAGFRVVARALFVGEDLADLQPRRLAVLLDARLTLLLGKPLQ